MDLNAAQTDGQTRAIAWLQANLDDNSSATPSAETPPPAVKPPEPGTPESKVATTPVEAKPGIADAIRKDREARAQAGAAQTEVAKYKAELDNLRKENEQLKALGASTDPFEFLRGRKLTKEQQAEWGQAFLYDLRPEVAPQEFRLDLYKAQKAREEQEKADRATREQAEQAEARNREYLDRYANDLMYHVQNSIGSNPESELWFSEDGPDGQPQLNHKVYAQSLLATANNLSRQAMAQGQQADLSPANIAKVLEQEVSKRMQRRDARKASTAKSDTKQVAPATPAPSGERTTVTSTTSADGLRGGSPVPLDMSEAGRKARAIAAAFGTK